MTGSFAADKPAPQCRLEGTVISADGAALLYRKGPSSSYDIFACVFKTGKTRRIGFKDAIYGGYLGVRLAGPFAGYVISICDHEGCSGRPQVRNLLSGNRRSGSETPAPADDGSPVVRSSGSIAWIRKNGTGSYEVHALDQKAERVLDSGPDIDPKSLALAGHRLYWLRGGAPRWGTLK